MVTKANRRVTVYFDPELHRALRLKAAAEDHSVSELVNQAIKQYLLEDLEDLAAVEERIAEPTISYEALLRDLKAHGKI
jgi:predicted transcriptional regulator